MYSNVWLISYYDTFFILQFTSKLSNNPEEFSGYIPIGRFDETNTMKCDFIKAVLLEAYFKHVDF